eukprot:scpid78401/ scgid27135/ Iodotyrosine dehalogenase 1
MEIDNGLALRIGLSLLAAVIAYILLVKSKNKSGERASNEPAVTVTARPGKDPAEEEFSDEPDEPVEDSDDEDPGAALEQLPRIKLDHEPVDGEEMCQRSQHFYDVMKKRRTVRTFSKRPVPREVVENIVRVGGTAPSGAHTEPWTYVVVSDPEIKAQIRDIVEREEEVNYDRRMGTTWVKDVTLLGTDHSKPYLDEAPYLIVAFEQTSGVRPDGKKKHHYYSRLSASISAGMLLAAVHYAGLVTVTSTPLNCYAALRDLLERPATEKAFLLLPIGYPSEDTTVPDLVRKPLEDIMVMK